jgi:hypothetical protein
MKVVVNKQTEAMNAVLAALISSAVNMTQLPPRTISPPKYPAAAMSPDVINIRIRYSQSPVLDISSLTISLQTAKAISRPNAGQINR